MIKVIKSKNIVTCGNGNHRIVLDYDANVIYQYHDITNIKAVYEQGQWHLTERPDSNRSGWGTHSSGDTIGDSIHSNAIELLRAIDAKATVYNIPTFFDENEYQVYLKTLAKVDRINKTAKALKINHSFNTTFKKIIGKSMYTWASSKSKGKSKGLNPLITINKITEACKVFLNRKGKTIKVANYIISKNSIKQYETTVAFYDSQNQLFMNSQVLTITNFERAFLGGQSIIQDIIRPQAKYNIPFNVLESANLLLSKTNVIDTGPESTHTVNGESRHFTGALLLENMGRKFLMDLDQIEIQHKLFNIFFVEVSKDVNTINEAYVSMKPDSVKQAESVGIKVERQGEWFFIKTDKSIQVTKKNILQWAEATNKGPRLESFDIAHGKGRPNHLYKPLDFGPEYNELVCGMVTHSGREHEPLSLGIFNESNDELNKMPSYSDNKDELYTFNLWQVVPNTTIGSFTITGDVD